MSSLASPVYFHLHNSFLRLQHCDIQLPERAPPPPPLSPSASLKQKLDFLRVCGLTTLVHRDELLAQKRRKRRRMLRERSVSPPPAVQTKRKAASPSAPAAPLTTPYTAEQMDGGPGLEEKKDFLLMFKLSHVSPQQRRGNELLIIHKHFQRATLLSSHSSPRLRVKINVVSSFSRDRIWSKCGAVKILQVAPSCRTDLISVM